MLEHAIETRECPTCGGSGWKTASIDRGVRKVTRCDCHLVKRAAALLQQAQIPLQYQHCTLTDFDLSFPGATKSLEKALLIAKGFIQCYPVEKEGILLWGPCGTGKTHLAISILNELIFKKGIRCLFKGYSSLLKQIQATYTRQIVADEETGVVLTEYSILRDVIEAEVLVLDDLGAEQRQSEWTLSMLYHVINERYNERRATIITTNLLWEDPPNTPPADTLPEAQQAMRDKTLRSRISERTHSRIAEMCPHRLELTGGDYRRFRGARDNR